MSMTQLGHFLLNIAQGAASCLFLVWLSYSVLDQFERGQHKPIKLATACVVSITALGVICLIAGGIV